MRYKIFTLFAALTLSAGALFASDTAVDGIYYDFDATNLTATVTYRGSNSSSYADEYTGNVVIPATVTYGSNTYSVTSIGESAFYKCSGLTSVTIPNSVTSIGELAFYKCSGLTSVNIGNSVTSIGRSAFANCSVLTSVTIPNSVTSIGVSAFSECIGLTSVIIPNSVTSIGAWAFDGTAWLANQSDGVIYINQLLYTYKGEMPANTSISVLDGTTQICGGAFYDCSGLTSVTIPNSVTSIGMYAFESCSGLTSVTIPNSVTSIGDQAFDECTQLTNIVCYAAEPPSCDASSFANYNASLKVPYSSLEAYKADAVWGLFNNISYIESTVGLEQIELAGLYTQAGRIVCEGEFRIYDLLGRDVTRLNGSLHGVYVVKTANAAVKVVVR
ncbi:MAG: leucine-rich repeat domain-containing protein [Bacteroidales bacterium]|nr:leucine-rich repeat domain-containing protein [Bacteroidales bacterium]